ADLTVGLPAEGFACSHATRRCSPVSLSVDFAAASALATEHSTSNATPQPRHSPLGRARLFGRNVSPDACLVHRLVLNGQTGELAMLDHLCYPAECNSRPALP